MLTKVNMSQNYLQNYVVIYTNFTQYGRNTLEIHTINFDVKQKDTYQKGKST